MAGTVPSTHQDRPPYRPALDGLRALAILGVLLFHLNPEWLPGGWFGVDLFFVLSGFLITTLIVREQNRTGRVRLVKFWMARMRRLLPALFTVLTFTLVVGWFLLHDDRRISLAKDATAALFYVANWRFLFGAEGYFATLAMPSPLRHTWSLAIEEQFYLVFPVVMAVLGWLSTRRIVHAAVLGVAALLSAVWMFHLHEPTIDPVRVYFGTDTRVFELLIGAVAAILLRKHAFDGFSSRTTHFIHAAGWVGMVGVIAAMILLGENDSLPYRGGLFALGLFSLAMIVVAASSPDTWFSKFFALEPLRWFGLISYPLYLWHWPVIVFFDAERTGLTSPWLQLLQAAASVLLAWITYQVIETPIRSRRPLIPGQPFASKVLRVAAAPLILLGAYGLTKTDNPAGVPEHMVGGAVLLPADIVSNQQFSTMLLGNSVPASLVHGLGSADHSPWMAVHANTNVGCDPFPGIKWTDGKEARPTADCIAWRKRWPSTVHAADPDLVLYFIPQSLVTDVIVDGEILEFGTSTHDSYLADGLDRIKREVERSSDASLALANLSCHELPTFDRDEAIRINDSEFVGHLNDVVGAWADKNGVGVIDMNTALCPDGKYSATVNEELLYSDNLHFTKKSAPIVWDWMVPQLVALAEDN